MFDSKKEKEICKRNGGNCQNCELVLDPVSRICKMNGHKDIYGEAHFDDDEYINRSCGISKTDISGSFTIHLEKPGTFDFDKKALEKSIASQLDTVMIFASGRCKTPKIKVTIDNISSVGGRHKYIHYC